MRGFFSPSGAVVVGTTFWRNDVAWIIVNHLKQFGFAPIHLLRSSVQHGSIRDCSSGSRICTSFDELPPGIELALVITPAHLVPRMLEGCGRQGINRAVIFSGGFAELDEEGKQLQNSVKTIVAKYGMRVIGPNSSGIINYHGQLMASFFPYRIEGVTRPGGVSIFTQSGGTVADCLSPMVKYGMGFDRLVSMGNKLDVDEVDLLRDVREESAPELVYFYLEEIKRGRRFIEEIRRCRFPVVVHKGNTTAAGSRTALSHTAALAGDDRILTGALKQAGAIRVQDGRGVADLAQAFRLSPVMGNGLAIIARGGGHAVLAADLAEKLGFHLPLFDPHAEPFFQSFGSTAMNPIDMGGLFRSGAEYREAVEKTLKDERVDAVLLIHICSPDEVEASARMIEACWEVSQLCGKPLYLCVAGREDERNRLRDGTDVVLFDSLEEGLAAMAEVRDYFRRSRELLAEEPLDISLTDSDRISRILDEALRTGRTLLTVESLALLSAAGLPVAPFAVAQSVDEIGSAAVALGCPLALKVLSPDISHKFDLGGVILNIPTPQDAVRQGKRLMAELEAKMPQARIEGFLVQRMVDEFLEVFLGGKRDASFGPVVMVGMGGILVDILQDVSLRLVPLSRADAAHMLEELSLYKAFQGFRGRPPADIPFLIQAIGAIARLMQDYPTISEIDVNPLKLHQEGRGGTVVDARIVLRMPQVAA